MDFTRVGQKEKERERRSETLGIAGGFVTARLES